MLLMEYLTSHVIATVESVILQIFVRKTNYWENKKKYFNHNLEQRNTKQRN
jgi:hypothetical protein